MAVHNGDIELPAGGSSEVKNLIPERVTVDPPIDPAEQGRIIFNTVENTHKYNDGSTWVIIGNINQVGDVAPIYITDIEPQDPADNVTSKVYEAGGFVLDTVVSNTLDIRVHFITESGSANYVPTVDVEGDTGVTLTNQGIGQWSGYIDITIAGSQTITVEHEDGATDTCSLTYSPGPQILSAVFSSGYPGSQTELKEGDTIDITVTTDIPMTSLYVVDNGTDAGQANSLLSFPATTSKVITCTIADRGDVVQALGATLQAEDSIGSKGPEYSTTTGGAVDGVNVVNCNNLHPAITPGSITYPVSQSALKNVETADVDATITDFDTVIYTSPTSELTVAAPTTYAVTKTVTRASGGYNVTTNNYRISATRSANAATTVQDMLVNIAHDAPIITLVVPAARLRSGGNVGTSPQDYTIQLSSNQQMQSGTMEADLNGNPGTLTTAWTDASATISEVTLQVHDNDTKGTYQFGNLTGTNLAGLSAAGLTSPDYTLGGFVLRTMTVSAWPNREANIGTTVSDTAKLECTNLSKGASGSLNFTYNGTLTDAIDQFTITSPSGVPNATGNLWYNKDVANAVSNSTGNMTVEIEEVV